ncbi:MAG: hypothetical protein ACK4SY_10695 [Pyrobaculum sp.]
MKVGCSLIDITPLIIVFGTSVAALLNIKLSDWVIVVVALLLSLAVLRMKNCPVF